MCQFWDGLYRLLILTDRFQAELTRLISLLLRVDSRWIRPTSLDGLRYASWLSFGPQSDSRTEGLEWKLLILSTSSFSFWTHHNFQCWKSLSFLPGKPSSSHWLEPQLGWPMYHVLIHYAYISQQIHPHTDSILKSGRCVLSCRNIEASLPSSRARSNQRLVIFLVLPCEREPEKRFRIQITSKITRGWVSSLH